MFKRRSSSGGNILKKCAASTGEDTAQERGLKRNVESLSNVSLMRRAREIEKEDVKLRRSPAFRTSSSFTNIAVKNNTLLNQL